MGYFDKTIEFIENTSIEELEKKMREYGVKFVENPNYKGDNKMKRIDVEIINKEEK
jgi:hypothetical protein